MYITILNGRYERKPHICFGLGLCVPNIRLISSCKGHLGQSNRVRVSQAKNYSVNFATCCIQSYTCTSFLKHMLYLSMMYCIFISEKSYFLFLLGDFQLKIPQFLQKCATFY